MTITFGSIFSGIGGFDLGFEQAGMRCLWQIEIDPKCQQVLSKSFPETLRFKDVITVTGEDLPEVDIICFGSPCQDLSTGNSHREGLNGKQSSLFHQGIRLISELNPAFGVWENVPGSLTSNSGRDFAIVLREFHRIRAHDIAWRTLDARYFGVPHQRRRVFLVSDFRGERAGQVLFEREQDKFNLKRRDTRQPETSSFKRRGGFGWSESKEVSLTIEAGGNGDKIPIVFTNGLPRRLTPIECERLLGFPDDWTYLGKDFVTERYKQLGNSIVVPVAKWIGQRLIAFFKD